MDETLDPRSGGAGADVNTVPVAMAAIHVLFHADLRRVEDVYLLGPASADSGTVVVGRDQPLFVAAARGKHSGLCDPCISRQQFSVRYLSSPPRFEVVVSPEARRGLRFFTDGGAPLEAAGTIPPNSLIAIGDRLLLWLGVLPFAPVDTSLGMVGTSAEIRHIRSEIEALAGEASTVLIRGETGTGKELVARALHEGGSRAKEPFVAVNCAALPEALIESELFGHVQGAFSGAARAREGLFRSARKGTLFLDEIGELSLSAQAKLLRTLQERTVRPLGDAREYEASARVVAATHRPLEADVASGRFRADLLARIERPRIELVPLRERRVDIPILFVHFLARAATDSGTFAEIFREASIESPVLPMALMLSLLAHPWSRNIRELEKYATTAELSFRRTGRFAALKTSVSEPAPPEPLPEVAVPTSPRGPRANPNEAEILLLLDEHDFVQRRVADALGVSRTTLDKWMREYGIRRPSDIGVEEIEAAREAHGRDLRRVAAALKISLRGLKLRLRELGLSTP
jgi:two-component system nitrogen regulation response regulator GlnG